MPKETELLQRLNAMTTTLAAHPVLAIIASDALSRDEWRNFAVERYLSAIIFEPLLDTALTATIKANDTPLADALRDNQQDELGMDIDGVVDQTLAHAAWRKHFYDALGVDDDMLNAHIGSPAVKAYMDVIRSVMMTGEYLVMAGAMLALERFLPVEFRAMQQGRDLVFADIFTEQPTDTPEERDWRERARLYLDEHIPQDLDTHFPELLAAIELHTDNEASMERILSGIAAVEQAKLAFYDKLEVKQ